METTTKPSTKADIISKLAEHTGLEVVEKNEFTLHVVSPTGKVLQEVHLKVFGDRCSVSRASIPAQAMTGLYCL